MVVSAVVTPELFTTKHRALGMGSATSLSRMGGECVLSGRNKPTDSSTYLGTPNGYTVAVMHKGQPRTTREN